MKNQVLHQKKFFANIRELIEWSGETHADAPAYSYRPNPHKQETVTRTFSELRDDVRALAASLNDIGCAGSHCALIGKFSYEWVLTYLAVLSIGGVLVPLDRDWAAEDLADTVKKADVKFLFADEDISDKSAVIAKSVRLAGKPTVLQAKEETGSLRALIETGRPLF